MEFLIPWVKTVHSSPACQTHRNLHEFATNAASVPSGSRCVCTPLLVRPWTAQTFIFSFFCLFHRVTFSVPATVLAYTYLSSELQSEGPRGRLISPKHTLPSWELYQADTHRQISCQLDEFMLWPKILLQTKSTELRSESCKVASLTILVPSSLCTQLYQT